MCVFVAIHFPEFSLYHDAVLNKPTSTWDSNPRELLIFSPHILPQNNKLLTMAANMSNFVNASLTDLYQVCVFQGFLECRSL